MPFWVLNIGKFLLNPRVLLGLAAAVAAAWIGWKVWDFVDDKYAAEARVAQLERVVAAKEAEIETLNFMSKVAEQAAATADAAQTEVERQNETHRELRDQALSSKEKDDGSVAPVLRRTLDALGELR